MENKSILNIILVSILLIYVFFFTYLIVRYVVSKNKDKNIENKEYEKVYDSKIKKSNYNTDFYNRSVEHAIGVLFNKYRDPQYGEINFYANKLIDTIGKINNETKESIVVVIKYFSIEASQARENEQLFRNMSEQEGAPLWFSILREATKKAIPEFSADIPVSENNIIPLYKQTG